MNPQTPNPQPDNLPEHGTTDAGVPTVDPSTGVVSIQPITTEPTQTPMQPNDASQAVTNPVPEGPIRSGKKRWALSAAIVGVLAVLLAAGYVFGMYLPNRPSALYAKSLQRSSQAVDALISYTGDYTKKDYKTYNLDGSFRIKTSEGSMDGTIKGDMDQNANASVAMKANVMGEKISADFRTIHVESSANPDIYVRVSGIKPLLAGLGASGMGNLDGQWISVDHTVLDTYSASLVETEAIAEADSMPTSEQVHDAAVKAQEVNKRYIFTTDKSKAVLKQSQYVGKETKDGRAVYHYEVGYDKAHLQAYVKAMGDALDASKLNDWSESANGGKKISEVTDFTDLEKSVKDAKITYTFDMWVDAETKLVHQLQFTDPSDTHTSFSLAQNYTGGDNYPFALTVSSMESGTAATASMKFNINKKTNVASGELLMASGANTATLTFDVTPSNKELKVSAPSGALSVMSLLNQLGINGNATELTSNLESLDGLTSL